MPSVGLLPSAGTRQKWNVPCAESLPSAWGSALGKEFVCRVPVVWHSANNKALGIYAVSGSGSRWKNTMNTAGLEWFGPPERNTLRPLCVVLRVFPSSRESLRELGDLRAWCVQRAPPFYISREARTWSLGPRQLGLIDVV